MTYLDQVVQFIEKNSGGVSLGSGSGQFVDPYTGSTRYQPTSGGGGGGGGGMSGGSDPFTGEWMVV
jgi:phospholipase A-2-activating protein